MNDPTSDKADSEQGGGEPQPGFVLKLYLAGSAPNSLRAKANLTSICRQYLNGVLDLEIVDVLNDPGRALEVNVLVTPTLDKLAPDPAVRIIGDLGDRGKVLNALGLGEIDDDRESTTRGSR